MSSSIVRNTLWRKFFLFIALPFLLAFGFLLFSIVYSIYEGKVSLADHLLVNKTRFNVEHIKLTINSIYQSTEAAANLISHIDVTERDARKRGEIIVQQMLRNHNIYNAWLAYEPNAFDGKDAEDQEGYPGAPSGRFLRSYIRNGDEIVTIPDMNESTINDPRESSWYTGAFKTHKPYININETTLYDYQGGQGTQNVYSITIPLFRNGIQIGCIGADGKIDELFSTGNNQTSNVYSMIFSGKLVMMGGVGDEHVGKTIYEVGLSDLVILKKALRDNEPILLRNTRFDIIGGNAMVSFNPVTLDQFNKEQIWIVTALPFSVIYKTMYSVIAITTVAMFFFSLLFLYSLLFIMRAISLPMLEMTRVADSFNLDETQLETPRDYAYGFRKIGASFHQMLSVFCKRTEETRWQQKMLDFYMFLEESLKPDVDLIDFFHHAADRFVNIYQARSVTLRLYKAANTETVVHYDVVSGFKPEADGETSHWQDMLWKQLREENRGSHIVWKYNDNAQEDKANNMCAFPLYLPGKGTEGEFAGAIFLYFDMLPSDDIERHAAFMAEKISHLLMGKELSLG